MSRRASHAMPGALLPATTAREAAQTGKFMHVATDIGFQQCLFRAALAQFQAHHHLKGSEFCTTQMPLDPVAAARGSSGSGHLQSP